MAPHLKITLGKDHQNVSWSKLIYDDRSLKSLADARSVTQARQHFNFFFWSLASYDMHPARSLSTLWYRKISANWPLVRSLMLRISFLSFHRLKFLVCSEALGLLCEGTRDTIDGFLFWKFLEFKWHRKWRIKRAMSCGWLGPLTETLSMVSYLGDRKKFGLEQLHSRTIVSKKQTQCLFSFHTLNVKSFLRERMFATDYQLCSHSKRAKIKFISRKPLKVSCVSLKEVALLNQRIKLSEGCYSKWDSVPPGVPQGTKLGP